MLNTPDPIRDLSTSIERLGLIPTDSMFKVFSKLIKQFSSLSMVQTNIFSQNKTLQDAERKAKVDLAVSCLVNYMSVRVVRKDYKPLFLCSGYFRSL